MKTDRKMGNIDLINIAKNFKNDITLQDNFIKYILIISE